MRKFLFLQGPHGSFFKNLGLELEQKGNKVFRINLCGGDWLDWHGKNTLCYRGRKCLWGAWISDFLQHNKITDLMVFGDWRPLHSEAITIAKIHNINVWVFEEGYLRPYYITMEKNGVNGRSELFKNIEDIEEYAKSISQKDCITEEPVKFSTSLSYRMWLAFRYASFEFLARPFFPFYKTHRPTSILKEFIAWIPRIATRKKQRRDSINELRKLYRLNKSFFLFPLQLDSDSQVRLYSPFSGMKEAIVYVMTSFAQYADKDELLVIRNHPMDNGLINYKRFIKSFAKALNVENRVFFVETGNAKLMMKHTKAMVVLNSTIGMTALKNGLPVYCVGTSIYAREGLALDKSKIKLDKFWNYKYSPSEHSYQNFETVLLQTCLINGSFYVRNEKKVFITNVLKRILIK